MNKDGEKQMTAREGEREGVKGKGKKVKERWVKGGKKRAVRTSATKREK